MNDHSQNNCVTTGIPISSVITGFRCIRQYYFGKTKKRKSSGRYTICKQISSAEAEFRNEDDLWSSILLIDPDIDPESRTFLQDCLKILDNLSVRSWTDLDITVKSDKLCLYGLIDKYNSKKCQATIVRCSKSPKAGCWAEDRIRIAALILCINETLNIRLSGMYVEYIPSGVIRYYEPGPKDRRILINTLKKVHEVDKGYLPEKPLNPPCKGCQFYQRCSNEGPNTLLDIIKKS